MIGIDLVAIDRIASFVERHGDLALERFLSADEIALANGRSETIAGFWAAKEAVSKALGCGICARLGFHDIAIIKDSAGAPHAVLSDRAFAHFGVSEIAVSITHEKTHAAAVAILR
ncbi:holo-[acyl-carrier-protein] synthase [Campylobacterota bacterium]|nr:holo-[acyl-carrier-protein] synthase [Campylobacterota bacterium]